MTAVVNIPINKAHPGWTKPQAGVTATRPTMGPTQAPAIEMCPRIASITTQVVSPPAAAICVLTSANAARPLETFHHVILLVFVFVPYLAPLADPPLNPDQPTHNSDVPRMVNGRLCAAVLFGS